MWRYLAPQVSIPTFPAFVYWTLQGVRISPHLPPRYLPKPFIHLSLQNVRLVTSPGQARGLTAPWKTQYCLQQHVEHPARVYLDLLGIILAKQRPELTEVLHTTCSQSAGWGPGVFSLLSSGSLAQPHQTKH